MFRLRNILIALSGLIIVAVVGVLVFAWLLEVSVPSNAETSDIAALLVEERLPSLSYATIENGRITEARTLGVADTESSQPAKPVTLYEAASLTKPLIAHIAMRLNDQRVFDLDEPVSQTLPSSRFEDTFKFRQVTPRHLLAHMSGLPNWSGNSNDPRRTDKLSFAFAPGDDFSYSGEGYGLLSTFLERKSRQKMEALANALFAELGMTRSTLIAAGFEGEYARGHWGLSAARSPNRTDHVVPAYSLFTTANDYARFLVHAITAPDVSESTRAEFRRIQTRPIASGRARDGSAHSLAWSLGWGVLKRSKDPVYFQWGDNGAFRSFAAFSSERGTGIVYFSNGSYGTLYADELAEPLLGDVGVATSWFSGPLREAVRRIGRF